tara:strand:- start:741 stop:1154 length:414 start_codon:yes stop_codon:yes gene_type:complete
MENDKEIFDGKTFSSLAKDIYFNSSHKKDQINQLIKDLREMVTDMGSATVVAPMIRDYIDVGVKNDDQLVKLSAVLQRYLSNDSSSDGAGNSAGLSDEEKEQLLSSVKSELNSINNSEDDIEKQIKTIKDKIPRDGA